jgi:diguanylate cyclase (GGDEF)-like protein
MQTSAATMMIPFSIPLFGKTAALISIIFMIDYMTPAECDVSALYGAAIIYASWHGNTKQGLATAALCVLTTTYIVLIQNIVFSREIYFYLYVLNKIFIMFSLSIAVSWCRRALNTAIATGQTDPLTGIANRRALQERIALEINRSKRNKAIFAFAYIDIDNFKAINDQMGHDVGDAVLVATTRTLCRHLRSSDLAARIGGDEFCILLPDCTRTEGAAVIRRLRQALQGVMAQQQWPVTFSIGLAAFDNVPESVEQVIAEADRLMYAAKRGGKDTVVHSAPC